MENPPETHQEYSQNFKRVLSVWLGALILCIPALLNHFPFFYPDTGTYLVGGFNGETSEIRPIAYGLFMRLVSLRESLWFVVLVQGLIVSWSIHAFYRTFSKSLVSIWPVASIMLFTFMTGIGEVASMLMPDFLTPVMILCGAILLYGGLLSWWRLALVGALMWLAIASHHSNGYIFFILLIINSAIRLIIYWKHKTLFFPVRRMLLVVGLALAGYFTIPFLHWSVSGEFYWSKAKSVFITNRVNEMGLLKPFLRKNCPGHDYRLCASIEEIPVDLLWGLNSPLAKSGGFAANDEEYGRMLKDFFRQPYFVRKFLIKTLENGIIQFFTIEGTFIFKEQDDGYAYAVMKQTWPEYEGAIYRSHQYWNRWSSEVTQVLQRFLVYGSFLFFLFYFVFGSSQRFTLTQRNIVGFVMLALLINAMVCGGISMVDVRFQYRVVWLVPFLALWLAGEQNLLVKITIQPKA